MENEIRLEFGRRIRALRKERGWTQPELAERANIDWRHVQRLEGKKVPPPVKIDTILKIAKAFGMTPAELMNFSPPAAPL